MWPVRARRRPARLRQARFAAAYLGGLSARLCGRRDRLRGRTPQLQGSAAGLVSEPARSRSFSRAPTIVGIDTGGTFTDLIAIVGGELRVHKVLSTPRAPAA